MKYVLIGQTPVRARTSQVGPRFETADRAVKQTEVAASVISTVFLGVDHQVGGGPPMLFETMIFADGEAEESQLRCSTWCEAEQHVRVVEEKKRMRRQIAPSSGAHRGRDQTEGAGLHRSQHRPHGSPTR